MGFELSDFKDMAMLYPAMGGLAGGSALAMYLFYRTLTVWIWRVIALVAIVIIATGGGIFYYILKKMGYKKADSVENSTTKKVTQNVLDTVVSFFDIPALSKDEFLRKVNKKYPTYTAQ